MTPVAAIRDASALTLAERLVRLCERARERNRQARETRTASARLRTAIGAVLGVTVGGARPSAPQPAAAAIAPPPDLDPSRAAPAQVEPEPKHAPHLRALRALLAGSGSAHGSQVVDDHPPFGCGARTSQGP